jgi:hypothetical protein
MKQTPPALIGSEKQIAWAEDIRRAALAKMEAHPYGGEPWPAAALEVLELAISRATSAAWWIHHRGASLNERTLIKEFALAEFQTVREKAVQDQKTPL